MKKLILIAAVALAIFPVMYVSGFLYIVDDTQFAIKTQLGKVSKVIKDQRWRVGYRIPFLQELYTFPAKMQSWDAASEPIVTLDKKSLIIDNYFKWRIDDVVLFRNSVQTVGTANRRLESIVHDAVKDVLGNTTLNDIVSGKQEEVIHSAVQIANKSCQGLGIKIVDVRFKKVQLPSNNEARLYERMKSERMKEAAFSRSQGQQQATIIRSQAEREVKVIEAEAYKASQQIRGDAEARAAEIYAQAFSRDPEFYTFWRTLQTYRNTMDSSTTLLISPESDLYRYLASP